MSSIGLFSSRAEVKISINQCSVTDNLHPRTCPTNCNCNCNETKSQGFSLNSAPDLNLRYFVEASDYVRSPLRQKRRPQSQGLCYVASASAIAASKIHLKPTTPMF